MRLDEYWVQRQEETNKAVSRKNITATQKQLRKYYKASMERVLKDFEAVYDKLLATAKDGGQPTPADLYKLDKYWEMQGQLQHELQKLGDKSMGVMQKQFIAEYKDIYKNIALPSAQGFATIDTALAKQMVNAVWCADGYTWTQRIWNNIDYLQQTLNDELINCVVTGKKTSQLKKLLQNRFGVSHYQSDRLVRTEIAHIQTEAAKKRYEDYGLKRYEYHADPDDRTCKHGADCEALHGKIFYFSEMQAGVNAPPMHPNCRCAILPVIE